MAAFGGGGKRTTSKYRHVFGTPYKRDKCYDNIRISKSPHESNMCAVNGKFLAVCLEAQGGGSFVVFPLEKVGRFDIDFPKVSGHTGLVIDLAWNPFNQNEIASSSEDQTIKLWTIPDEGLTQDMTVSLQTLEGHSKKVGQILWHPSAEDVLASFAEKVVIIWNTKTAEQLLELPMFPDKIYCLSWSYNGRYLAATCKDKKLRVYDVRKNECIAEGKCHEGNKPSRVTFCGPSNKLFTTGFSRATDRQYAYWDPTDLSKPKAMENIDTGSGVQFLFYDDGTRMVYLVGKGDTQIRYFALNDDATPPVSFLSMYQSTIPQRGCGFMPKRHLDYMHTEVARFYKLQQTKGMVEPIPMTVPRKSVSFQDDIYPPCEAGIAAMTAEEWMLGMSKDPRLTVFTKDGLVPASPSEEDRSKPIVPGVKEASKKRGRSSSSNPDEPATLEEYRVAYKELQAENEKLKKDLKQLRGH